MKVIRFLVKKIFSQSISKNYFLNKFSRKKNFTENRDFPEIKFLQKKKLPEKEKISIERKLLEKQNFPTYRKKKKKVLRNRNYPKKIMYKTKRDS